MFSESTYLFPRQTEEQSRKLILYSAAKVFRKNIGKIGATWLRAGRRRSTLARAQGKRPGCGAPPVGSQRVMMAYTDEDLDALDTLLQALPQGNMPMTLSELNGYLTGVLAAPVLIPPSE